MVFPRVLCATVLSLAASASLFAASAAELIFPGSMCVASGRNVTSLGLSFSAVGNQSQVSELRVDCPIVTQERVSPEIIAVEVWTREFNGEQTECEFVAVPEISDVHGGFVEPMPASAINGNIFQHITGNIIDIERGYYYVGCTLPTSFESIITHYVVTTR